MASIQRTAYPRFKRMIGTRDLQEHYTPTQQEWTFVQQATRLPQLRFNMIVLLKVFQQLGYFPALHQIPAPIHDHIRTVLLLPAALELHYDADRTLRDHYQAIRAYLTVLPYGKQGRHIATVAVFEAAHTMDLPPDLINVAIEALRKARVELPAFSTLDVLVERIRSFVNYRIYRQIADRLPSSLIEYLDQLLIVPAGRRRSDLNRIKELPGKPTRNHLKALEDRLHWLESLGIVAPFLVDIPPGKVQHFAAEAKILDAAALRDDVRPPKRWVVLACLLHQAQVDARDDLVDMFRKYIRQRHKEAKAALIMLRERQRETTERLLTALNDIAQSANDLEDDPALGAETRQVLTTYGGAETVMAECTVLSVYNGDNYLPLLPSFYRSARTVLFRLLDLLTIEATTEDDGLVAALSYLRTLRTTRRMIIPASVSLEFATEQWHRVIVLAQGKRKKKKVFERRLFELCVFTALADGLKTGDLAVQGSERYADYRTHLLPWSTCEPLVVDYCRELDLASTAQGLVFQLWMWLKGLAEDVDRGYPEQSELVIADDGAPSLKRLARKETPQYLALLEGVIGERMPDRTIIDTLANVAYWTDWPQRFGPVSGFDPKMPDAIERYVLTAFCFGCNLGPAETERHTRGRISAQTLSTINRQHVSVRMLEAARRDMIGVFNQLALPALWGDATIAGVDGTQYDLAEDNLVAEYSFRYRVSGGIAYHHISDRYIALFIHFITCGTWEAVYLIDGLMKNTSELQPTTIHGDTQVQSTPVFALTYLLGIDLLPRIRNWKGLTFFRPSKGIRYQHLEPLFTGEIDWDLIATHWQDLMQVVLSIKAGKLLPSTLLRKLTHESKKNKLYQAFRELGRVIRTIFLLRYISNLDLRHQIQATTNKVEAYNGFCDWHFFGNGGIIEPNDPAEMEKRMHYKDLVANAVILQNTVDLTKLLLELRQEGYPVTKEVVARLSPYLTGHLRRYGDYAVNVEDKPDPIDPRFDLPE